MRKIGISDIEDIALGAALLGAGGGGDPYVGKLVAIGAVQECGAVTLLDPDEVPDDALVVPIAMMGAPTVLADVSPDSPVMSEEIFGPVLPVLAYESLDEAVAFWEAQM